MKPLKFALIALTVISCAPIRVSHDFDSSANFNSYKTYQYYGDMETGLSELDTKRFLDAIDAQMATKGFGI